MIAGLGFSVRQLKCFFRETGLADDREQGASSQFTVLGNWHGHR